MLYDKVTGKAEKEVLYFRAYLKQQLTKSLFQTRSSPDEPEELLFTGNIPRGVLLARNEP